MPGFTEPNHRARATPSVPATVPVSGAESRVGAAASVAGRHENPPDPANVVRGHNENQHDPAKGVRGDNENQHDPSHGV